MVYNYSSLPKISFSFSVIDFSYCIISYIGNTISTNTNINSTNISGLYTSPDLSFNTLYTFTLTPYSTHNVEGDSKILTFDTTPKYSGSKTNNTTMIYTENKPQTDYSNNSLFRLLTTTNSYIELSSNILSSYIDNDMSGNTYYSYYFVSKNNDISSTPISFYTNMRAPSDVSMYFIDSSSVGIFWSFPKNNYNTSYYNELNLINPSGSLIQSSTGINNLFQQKDLSKNTTYNCYIQTYLLTQGNTIITQKTEVPYIGANIYLTDVSMNSLNLNWKGSYTTSSNIYRGVGFSENYTNISNTNVNLIYNDTDISGNTVYYYYIIPYSGIYNGEQSSIISTTTPVAYPTDFSAAFYDSSAINLSFRLPKNSYKQGILYTAYAEYQGNVYSKSGINTPLLIQNLNKETIYKCYINTDIDGLYTSTSQNINITTKSNGYRYIKIVFNKIRTYGNDMVQFGEWYFYTVNNNYIVNPTLMRNYTTSNSHGGTESPTQGIDNNINTKCALRPPQFTEILIDYTTEILPKYYKWATANDSDGRDPASWQIYGSNNLVSWNTLSVVSNYTSTTSRLTINTDVWTLNEITDFSSINNNMIYYYKFNVNDISNNKLANYASGTADYSGNIITGNIITTDYKVGNSSYIGDITGTQTRILLPSFNTGSTRTGFTFALWFKYGSNTNSNNAIFSFISSTISNAIILRLGIVSATLNSLEFIINNTILYTEALFRPNVWYHIVCVILDTTSTTTIIALYVNGILRQILDTVPYPTLSQFYTVNALNCSDTGNSTSSILSPQYDDFRLYRTPLRLDEIKLLYNGSVDITTGLLCYYKFIQSDIVSSTSIKNYATGVYDATLSNSAAYNSSIYRVSGRGSLYSNNLYHLIINNNTTLPIGGFTLSYWYSSPITSTGSNTIYFTNGAQTAGTLLEHSYNATTNTCNINAYVQTLLSSCGSFTPTSNFNHICITVATSRHSINNVKTQMYVYINGTLFYRNQINNFNSITYNTMFVGYNPTTASRTNYYYDEIRLYNIPFNPEQVLSLYNNTEL